MVLDRKTRCIHVQADLFESVLRFSAECSDLARTHVC